MDSNNSDIRKITEEATEWFVQLRDIEEPSSGCTLEQAQRQQELFKQWLTQSPEHVHEYLMISQLWSDISDIEATDELT